MTNITCNLDAFLKINRFITTEETRYYLKGVYIHKAEDRPGIFLVATDGHTLGLWYDKEGTIEGESQIISISKDQLSLLNKVKNKEGSILTIDSHSIKYNEMKFQFDNSIYIDGSFPDYKRIINVENKQINNIAFNPTYIKKFEFKKNLAIQLYFETPNSPMKITVNGYPSFVGVLMPMKISTDESFLNHEFFNEKEQLKEVA